MTTKHDPTLLAKESTCPIQVVHENCNPQFSEFFQVGRLAIRKEDRSCSGRNCQYTAKAVMIVQAVKRLCIKGYVYLQTRAVKTYVLKVSFLRQPGTEALLQTQNVTSEAPFVVPVKQDTLSCLPVGNSCHIQISFAVTRGSTSVEHLLKQLCWC